MLQLSHPGSTPESDGEFITVGSRMHLKPAGLQAWSWTPVLQVMKVGCVSREFLLLLCSGELRLMMDV